MTFSNWMAVLVVVVVWCAVTVLAVRFFHVAYAKDRETRDRAEHPFK